MPRSPKRSCRSPGCANLSDSAYCKDHRQQYEKRPSASTRGYDSRWRKARAFYLAKHPLCVICYEKKRLTPATIVDHIQPHHGDAVLFWNESNWQALCKPCHDRKTAAEDGGFGNTMR